MVTVAEVVAAEELALDVVHLADRDRPVSWVATSELSDPTPYLQGGEVLLTTGLETAGWDGQWDPYVARLVAADVAALGLGVGLTHEAVPAPLVRACRTHGVNLVAVPRPTPFVRVSRAVAALLDAEAEHAAREALETQRLLTRAALRGDAAVVRRLARVVDGDAVVVDAPGAEAALAVRAGSTVVHPLGLAARPTTWLAVTTAEPLLDAHRPAVSTAAALLTLSLERRRERRDQDRAVRARALGLLLTGDVETAALLLDVGGASLPSGPVRLLVARGSGSDEVLEVLDDDEVVAARLGDDVVAVCPARRAAAVATALGERGVLVGVGTAVAPADADRSRDTAAHALAQATAAVPVRSWDQLQGAGITGLLGSAATPYAEEWLAPIVGQETLLATLSAYVSHHGSVGEVAAALGVHRNTVRNRVAAIEAALGRSLDDPATRAEAWIALSVLAPGGGS